MYKQQYDKTWGKRSEVPPSPGLLKKIQNTKVMINAPPGKKMRFSPAELMDVNDFKAMMARTPKSRAHTLLSKPKASKVTGSRKALVLLVDFSDKVAGTGVGHYEDMLFSKGTYATGSLRDYYNEVSWGSLDITGKVSGDGKKKGWFRAPQKLSYYTNNENGCGDSYPKNCQKLVEDAVEAAKPFIDFSEYDLDGDGMVDALFVVHAGKGAEETGSRNDIWSHQWTTSKPIKVNGVEVFKYSIEPEDGRVGVYCHELGHVFGLPDLYDYDYDSNGIGNWCLMSGGSWNNDGNTPAHFSAWCKKQMGWVTPVNVKANTTKNIPQVEEKAAGTILRLWTSGKTSKEYFLIENREKVGFDAYLPAPGLLIWHIDEKQKNNDDQTHYMVALEQADGEQALEGNLNSGDEGDPYPGSLDKRSYSGTTKPSSKSYGGKSTKVSVMDISDPAPKMKVKVKVK